MQHFCPNLSTFLSSKIDNIYNMPRKWLFMDKLKSLREDAQLRQIDVANVLGIDRTTYTSYEIDRDTMPINHLNTLCNYFDVSIDYILGLTKIRKYSNYRQEINKDLMLIKIAKLFNISRSTWTGYEYGYYQMPTLILYDIASKFHISIDYILGKID